MRSWASARHCHSPLQLVVALLLRCRQGWRRESQPEAGVWQGREQAAHSAPPYLEQAQVFVAVPAIDGAAARQLRGVDRAVEAARVVRRLADLSRALQA